MKLFYEIRKLDTLSNMVYLANKKRVINAINKNKKYVMILSKDKNKMGQYTKYKFLNKLTEDEQVCYDRYDGSWYNYGLASCCGPIVISGGPRSKYDRVISGGKDDENK